VPRRRESRERRRPEGALDPDDLEAGMERAREVLPALIDAMGFDLDSDVEIREDHVYVPLQGEDCKYLLEHRAEGLNALQFLVNKMVYRGGPTRILVDADGYRKERQDELVAKAHRIADEVRDSERSRSLGSLNPFERRLVHLALREDEDVRTVSRGEGFMKRMEITPRHGGEDARPHRPERRNRRRRERH
jgi:spoIIIJ-associated protein